MQEEIGLLTNQTGLDSQGRRTMMSSPSSGHLARRHLQSEHGVTGAMDTTDIRHSKDAATGILSISVYGTPTPLAGRPPIF
jgi:uncharacterized protein YbbC (DUF1343 family)